MMASVNGKTSVLENDGFPRPKNRDMMVAAPIGIERVKEQSVVRKNRQHLRKFQPIPAPPGRQQKYPRAAHLPQHPLDAPTVTFSPENLRESRQKGNADPGFWLTPGSRAPCARTPHIGEHGILRRTTPGPLRVFQYPAVSPLSCIGPLKQARRGGAPTVDRGWFS